MAIIDGDNINPETLVYGHSCLSCMNNERGAPECKNEPVITPVVYHYSENHGVADLFNHQTGPAKFLMDGVSPRQFDSDVIFIHHVKHHNEGVSLKYDMYCCDDYVGEGTLVVDEDRTLTELTSIIQQDLLCQIPPSDLDFYDCEFLSDADV